MQHTALEHDEARQAERTSLSWFRTVLGFAAVAAFVVRQAPDGAGRVVAFVVGTATLVVVAVAASLRGRALRASPVPRDVSPGMAAVMSIALLTFNALAIGLFH
jgi:hypothetical protein